MKPALTREEWEEYLKDFHTGLPISSVVGRNPHAVAALCLHLQPFGFAREDVEILDRVATGLGFQAMDLEAKGISSKFERDRQDALNSLADRIEALLPPEQNP